MRWQLFIRQKLVGILTYDYADMPFFYCRFSPEGSFAPYQQLFKREAELLEIEGISESREMLFDETCKLPIILVGTDGNVIGEMILHIDGEVAWFRY